MDRQTTTQRGDKEGNIFKQEYGVQEIIFSAMSLFKRGRNNPEI
jgi:hypothetical protein